MCTKKLDPLLDLHRHLKNVKSRCLNINCYFPTIIKDKYFQNLDFLLSAKEPFLLQITEKRYENILDIWGTGQTHLAKQVYYPANEEFLNGMTGVIICLIYSGQ